MRTISSTLLAAQKSASRTPFVKVEAKNKSGGVVRLVWERLYTGTEDDYSHSLAVAGDGSLVRVRITPPSDGSKLYRQRVADPGSSSDFSAWTYSGQYGCLAVAAAACDSEVSIFWINYSQELRRIVSTDYGLNWGIPEIVDYAPSGQVGGLSAAYKANGDCAVVFTDQANLYIKRSTSGNWQEKVGWGETTGDLSGAAVFYDADWDIVLAGLDSSGNFKLWSLVYGDGGEISSEEWSDLEEMATAPADGYYEYGGVFLDKPDVRRCFYVEKFTGMGTVARPFQTYSLPGSAFNANLWREPWPFDLECDYGLAIAHDDDYCWLSTPFGVWRAPLAVASLDLTTDVISLIQELDGSSGTVALKLDNSSGKYSTRPAPLEPGSRIEVSPGYVTGQGSEVSAGLAFSLEECRYISSGKEASLVLQSLDGWSAIKHWRARQQFRWNRSSEDYNIAEILETVLARCGLKLEVLSGSSLLSGYYPDFTIHTGMSGIKVIDNLTSRLPDLLIIEGDSVYLVNPQSSDEAAYLYGTGHNIIAGEYSEGRASLNRVQVEGYDPSEDKPVIVESFLFNDLKMTDERFGLLVDSSIETASLAEARGEAILRRVEIESGGGFITVPVNCGQQLYDVVEITDERAGLNAMKRLVTGIALNYNPARGEYFHRLRLGKV